MSRSIDELYPPFFAIPMPLNAAGQGPETDPAKVDVIVWEIWDCLNLAVCSTNDEAMAKLIAQRLNT